MQFSVFHLACLARAAWAQQPICAECQKGCNGECQAEIQSAFEAESKLWIGDVASDPFYATPDDAQGAVPGDILRWEDVPAEHLSSNWTIPASLSLSRFMYITEDVDDQPIPATAWVLLQIIRSLSSRGDLSHSQWPPHQ